MLDGPGRAVRPGSGSHACRPARLARRAPVARPPHLVRHGPGPLPRHASRQRGAGSGLGGRHGRRRAGSGGALAQPARHGTARRRAADPLRPGAAGAVSAPHPAHGCPRSLAGRAGPGPALPDRAACRRDPDRAGPHRPRHDLRRTDADAVASQPRLRRPAGRGDAGRLGARLLRFLVRPPRAALVPAMDLGALRRRPPGAGAGPAGLRRGGARDRDAAGPRRPAPATRPPGPVARHGPAVAVPRLRGTAGRRPGGAGPALLARAPPPHPRVLSGRAERVGAAGLLGARSEPHGAGPPRVAVRRPGPLLHLPGTGDGRGRHAAPGLGPGAPHARAVRRRHRHQARLPAPADARPRRDAALRRRPTPGRGRADAPGRGGQPRARTRRAVLRPARFHAAGRRLAAL